MSSPCTCGAPDCKKCFPHNTFDIDERIDEIEDEIMDKLKPFMKCISEIITGRLEPYHEVEDALQPLVAKEAIRRAKR